MAAQTRKVRSSRPATAAASRAVASTAMLNGWLTPRCSFLVQPRSCTQMVGTGPLRLAMPPITPPAKPAAASAARPPPRHDRRTAHQAHPGAVEDQQDADAELQRLHAHMLEQGRAERHAEKAGGEEGPQPRPAHAAPDAAQRLEMAGDGAEGHQRRRGHRRHGLQPEAQRHQRIAGAGEAVDETRHQGAGDNDGDVAGRRQGHVVRPPVRRR